MPKLKATTDSSGNVFYPVTIAEGIYDNDNSQTLDETLSEINTTLGGLGTAASKNVASSGNASSSEVVMGNDTRLSDSRPASDVYEWAKASTKPTYTKSEIGLGNVDNTADASKSVAYAANAGTVNNHSVNADVPSGAVFTDTTYESKAAVENGTDISLVTTGEKYSWNEKAEKDGNYPDLVAGNLVGAQSLESTFSYRPSAGSIDIDASGNATPQGSLHSIKGNTRPWNQLVQNGDFSDGTTSWTSIGNAELSVSDGELTLTKTSGYWSGATQVLGVLPGHKYYCEIIMKSIMENAMLAMYYTNGNDIYTEIGAIPTNSNYTRNAYITAVSASTGILYLLARGNEDAGLFCKIKNIQIIDLTLIYGSGNEPVTPEAFEADYLAWFGKPLGYEDYDAGSLRPVKMSGLKTVGFNQWDEKYLLGYHDGGSGIYIQNQNQLTSKNPIEVVPGGTYYFKPPIDAVICFDSNMNYKGIIFPDNGMIYFGNDIHYVHFNVSSSYGTTYNHDICVNLSHSGRRNGEYEAYWDSLLDVPVTTMKGRKDGTGSSVVVFPDGLKKAGTVYDEVVKRGSQTIAIKRIGSVDLGTLDWYKAGTQSADNNNMFFGDTSMFFDQCPGVLPIYERFQTFGNWESITLKHYDLLTNGILICDTYNDAAVFKTAMNGVMLYYELATPEEYVLDDFELPQSYYVDDWGTEEVVAPTGQVTIAPTLSMEYGVNAPDAIRNLPRNYVSAHEQQTFTESQMLRARTNIGLNDMARLGCGMGICTTNATTAAKEVSISYFLLVKHGEITVFFEKAVDVADATLNVSGTGAKAIKLNGSNIQPGVIRPRTTVTMKYDGSAWCITAIAGYEQSRSGKFKVDLGLPSGLIWADRNIDASSSGGFPKGMFDLSSYFSWGNIEGHDPDGGVFDYDFGTSNDGPYASTDGARLTGNIPPSMDAARAVCGAPWRMPTSDEFQELFDNCDFIDANGDAIPTSTTNKIITYGGVNGILLKSKINGNTIFFPAWGYGYGTSQIGVGAGGCYWSSTYYNDYAEWALNYNSNTVYFKSTDTRHYGFCIRPVQ